MYHILLNFLSLVQYQNELNANSNQIQPEYCACCKRLKPWRHATYMRKSDRKSPPGESLNPIMIQRYYCPGCKKTFSAIPECMSPKRWYLWEIQQQVLLLFIAGQSAYAITKACLPSYKTIKRWISRFQKQFLVHKDTLCASVNELNRTSGFIDFWKACLKKMTLGVAMRICHVAKVIIP